MNSNIIKPTLVLLALLFLTPQFPQAQNHGISGVWYNGNNQDQMDKLWQ